MEASMQAGRPPRRAASWRRKPRGFTLIAVLAALLLLGLASQGVMTYVSHEVQREREKELLRIGEMYARAIQAYYESSPGSVKGWPQRLTDLTEDRRFVEVRRHIRKVYADPVGRSAEWGIVMASDGTGIAGVHSLSDAAPLRTAAVELGDKVLDPAARYADWKFVYVPPVVAASR